MLALVHPKRDPAFEVLRSRALAAGAELYDRGESLPVSLATVAWFAGLCHRHRVQIWHGHDYKTNAIGMLLQRWFGYSLVCTLHGWSEETLRTRLYFALDRRVIRRYDQVIAVSSDLHTQARGLGVPVGRLTLIRNGVDATHYRRQAPLRADPRPLRIGAAGRLVPEKGFDVLINATEELLDEGHDVELTIAGEGPWRPALEAQVARSKHARRPPRPSEAVDQAVPDLPVGIELQVSKHDVASLVALALVLQLGQHGFCGSRAKRTPGGGRDIRTNNSDKRPSHSPARRSRIRCGSDIATTGSPSSRGTAIPRAVGMERAWLRPRVSP